MDTIIAGHVNDLRIQILTQLCLDYNLDKDVILEFYNDVKIGKRKPAKSHKRVEMVHDHELGVHSSSCRACNIWGNILEPDNRKIYIE